MLARVEVHEADAMSQLGQVPCGQSQLGQDIKTLQVELKHQVDELQSTQRLDINMEKDHMPHPLVPAHTDQSRSHRPQPGQMAWPRLRSALSSSTRRFTSPGSPPVLTRFAPRSASRSTTSGLSLSSPVAAG